MEPLQDQFNFWDNSMGVDNGFYSANVAFTPLEGIPPLPDLPIDSIPPSKGQEPTLQIFYEGPEKCDCCVNWIEKRPTQMPESERNRYNRAAICVYKRKDHCSHTARTGGVIDIKDDKVVLQSQFLINIIRPALTTSGFPVSEEGEINFNTPFKELYFAHSRILKISHMLAGDSEELKHVNLLISVMNSLFAEISASVSQQLSKKTVSYSCLWTLFPKNMVVYKKHKAQDRLFQVVNAGPEYYKYKRKDNGKRDYERTECGFSIKIREFAFDGTNFGVVEQRVLIDIFEGEAPITQLKVYPVGFHCDKDRLERRLASRGSKVLDYQNTAHCEFEGSAEAILQTDYVFLTVRVIVDAFHFSKIHFNDFNETEALEDDLVEYDDIQDEYGMIPPQDRAREPQRINRQKLPRIDAFLDKRTSSAIQDANRRFFNFNRRLLMLMDPNVPGFSLKHNKWFSLDVSKLREISWTPDPLGRLVFDESKKGIMSSFAQHHAKQMTSSNDFIASKGGGLVVLLSGPPGTGKTLTAEAIAEEARLPLYRILAGELGSSPVVIEDKLTEILDLALQWQCVVLLDEADTFVNKRISQDRVANEIVSIFLRQLEYFRGIIFLTSNLPHSIDDAFRSRCRLHIPYPVLKPSSRREVWRISFEKKGILHTSGSPKSANSQLDESNKLSLSPEGWNRLIEWKLSGREIHNVVENVALWCVSMGKDVSLAELEQTIELTVPSAKRGMEPESEAEEDEEAMKHVRKRPRFTIASR